MAHLHTSGKLYRINVYFKYGGKKHHKTTPFFCQARANSVATCACDGCKDARSWVDEIERKIRHNTFVYSEYFSDPVSKEAVKECIENKKFEDYAYEFLDYHCNTIEDSTESNYYSMVNQLCIEFGKMRLRDIKPVHVRNFISKHYDKSKGKTKGKANSLKTIKNKFGMLKMIMEGAVIDEIIPSNPCSAVKPPKGKTEPVDPFEMEEVLRILDWLKEHRPSMVAFYAIGFFTGMRTGEIMALKWYDINLNINTITVQRVIAKKLPRNTTKTAAYRIIDIIPALDEYLEWHKQFKVEGSDFLFNTYEGSYFKKTDTLLKSYWKPCLRELDIPYRVQYNTRHTFACMMIDANENLNWIKNMLGHKSLEMLMRVYGNKVHKMSTTGKRRGLKFQSSLEKQDIEPDDSSDDFDM